MLIICINRQEGVIIFFIAINNESEFETGEDPQLFGPFNSKDSAEKFLDGESSGIFNTIEDSGGEDMGVNNLAVTSFNTGDRSIIYNLLLFS